MPALSGYGLIVNLTPSGKAIVGLVLEHVQLKFVQHFARTHELRIGLRRVRQGLLPFSPAHGDIWHVGSQTLSLALKLGDHRAGLQIGAEKQKIFRCPIGLLEPAKGNVQGIDQAGSGKIGFAHGHDAVLQHGGGMGLGMGRQAPQLVRIIGRFDRDGLLGG